MHIEKRNFYQLFREYKYSLNKDGLSGIDPHQTTAPHPLLAIILNSYELRFTVKGLGKMTLTITT